MTQRASYWYVKLFNRCVLFNSSEIASYISSKHAESEKNTSEVDLRM